jgi:hypothetical protein
MSNKAWFFGDSFTKGDGCHHPYEYYEKYPELREKTWPNLISEKLNLEYVNKGISGNSNSYILKQVIDNLNNFKPGDYIFLSDTLPVRLVYPNKKTKKIESLITDIILWPEYNKKHGEGHINEFLNGRDERIVVIDFIYQSIMDNSKELVWSNYYNEQFDSIQRFLLSMGLEVYTWSYKLWNNSSTTTYYQKYESITKATKGNVEDSHWSWKGHKDFYMDFIKRIEKKEYKLNNSLI